MSTPEQDNPGGDSGGTIAMSELLSEVRLYPEEIVDLVSFAVGEARATHLAVQAEIADDLREDMGADDWLLIHYAVCDALSLTDSELWKQGMHYDQGEIPDHGLAAEERRYFGSLLDRNVEWFLIYSGLQKTRPMAEELASQELRQELAVRTVRLAYLSQLPAADYELRWQNYRLLNIARLTSEITSSVWRRMITPLDGV